MFSRLKDLEDTRTTREESDARRLELERAFTGQVTHINGELSQVNLKLDALLNRELEDLRERIRLSDTRRGTDAIR